MNLRIGVITISFLFSIVGVFYHRTGGLWPSYPIFGAISGLIIFFLIIAGQPENKQRSVVYLLVIVLFGLTFRAGLFLLPESLIDIDPQAFSVQTQWILESGTLDDLNIRFYDVAALFTSFNAMVAIITGLSPRHGFVVIPVVVAITVPIFTFAITRRLPQVSVTAGLIAALLSTVGYASMYYSITPRPQTITLPFFLMVFLISISYIREPSVREFVLLAPIGGAMIMSHKLPLMVFTVIILAVFVHEKLPTTHYPNHSNLHILVHLCLSLLLLQWIFVTDFFSDVVDITGSLLTSLTTGEFGIGSSDTFTQAVPAVTSLLRRSLSNSNLLFYVLAAVCGAIFLHTVIQSRKNDLGSLLVLSATALTGLLAGLGILFPVFGFGRFIFYGEPFFAVVVAIVLTPIIFMIHSQTPVTLQRALPLVGILLISIVIVAQFGATGLMPDSPENPRMILSGSEVEAQSWEADYIEGLAYADPYYADFVSNPEHSVMEEKRYEMTTVSQSWHPGVLEHSAFGNGTVLEQDYKFYSHRNSIEVYRLGDGYRLTWDIKGALETNHDKVYSNGDVETFHNK